MNENVISHKTRISLKQLLNPQTKGILVYTLPIDLVNAKSHLKGKLIIEMTSRHH
jgi:hypothetical protein